MLRYGLATIYARMRAAAARGDGDGISALIDEALGVDLGSERADVCVRPMLTYRGIKPAEWAMWRADVKPIVKFEDIPIATAAQLVADHGQAHFTFSAPYKKDYLLLRSSPCSRRDPAALMTIYACRDRRGVMLHELETTDPSDIAGAGDLLDVPPCCVEAFVRDTGASRADQDTVNDDAVIRLLRSVDDGGGHPALDPLSDHELLGFYPCSLLCEAAISRATRVFAALRALDPAAASQCAEQLGRPTLIFRIPFFARLIRSSGGWHVSAANVFPPRQVRAIQTVFAQRLASGLPALKLASETNGGPTLTTYDPNRRDFFDPE